MFKKTQVHYIEDNNNCRQKGHTAVGWHTLIGSGKLHRRGPNDRPVDEDLIIKVRPAHPIVYPMKGSILGCTVKDVSQESSFALSQPPTLVATLLIGSYIEIVHVGFSPRLLLYETDHPNTIIREFEKRCEITLDTPTKRVLIKKIERLLLYHKLKQRQ